MTKQYSMWVPGSAVVGQSPEANSRIIRDGGEALFSSPGEEWFQFPIPTPTVVQGVVGGRLARVLLLFDCDPYPGARLTRVDVWHGVRMIHRGGDIDLFGHDYKEQAVNGKNIFDVNAGHIVWGITISARVRGASDNSPMHFIGAGADFDFNV
jgi:hypothetical protein